MHSYPVGCTGKDLSTAQEGFSILWRPS
uniref:Uncharacterized protein n=1 Tax=Anguilla anguilla TaxID=7936 RepID=A0A0E9TR56_ANGAN